jgi:hypothetical protein
VQRLRGRRQALFISHRAYCPELHRIKESGEMLEVDTYQCTHAVADGSGGLRECGIRLYIIGRMQRWCAEESRMEELLCAVEVTRDELRVVRALSQPGDAIEYLETGF